MIEADLSLHTDFGKCCPKLPSSLISILTDTTAGLGWLLG